jgi:hypothetical protein
MARPTPHETMSCKKKEKTPFQFVKKSLSNARSSSLGREGETFFSKRS